MEVILEPPKAPRTVHLRGTKAELDVASRAAQVIRNEVRVLALAGVPRLRSDEELREVTLRVGRTQPEPAEDPHMVGCTITIEDAALVLRGARIARSRLDQDTRVEGDDAPEGVSNSAFVDLAGDLREIDQFVAPEGPLELLFTQDQAQ